VLVARRALALAEQQTAPDHPSVAKSLNNLAELYRQQGRYAQAEPLMQRALATRERALGPDHSDVGTALTNLAGLYRTQGRTAEAEPLFERALAIPKSDIKQLTVLFATNRRRADGKQTIAFGGERADRLSFGHGVLLAAREQVVQRAERRAAGTGLLDRSPAALTSEQVLAIRKVDTADDMGQLAKGLRSIPKDALVFVHGYNVGFEDALKRTAQIAFDLDYNGVLLTFTWPSRAALTGYGYDRESAQISADYLIELLDAAAKELPGTRLHLVAHSMGNLVVLSALEKIALRGATDRRLNLGEIILAHPDVDQDRFRQLAKAAKGLGARMTLYTSGDDRAMWISRLLSGKDRAGGEPIVVPGVDTIDITGLGARLWSANHTIYAANPIVFGDMARLIASGERPPDKRTRYFESVATKDGAYWRYRMVEVAGR
jgi:esterase/lipase superfamily enzyme